VGQDIEIGFLAKASASALWHLSPDESEKTFDAVFSPIVQELLTFERWPSQALKVVHVARTAMNRVSFSAALCLSRGEHAIQDGLVVPAFLRHHDSR